MIRLRNAGILLTSALFASACSALDPSADDPDGLIAFIGGNSDRFYQIFTMTPGGAGLTNVVNEPFDFSAPSWSPDRTRLAVSSNRDGNADWNIFVVDLATHVVTPVFRAIGAQFAPAWSSDGTRIAFQSVPEGRSDWDIFVVNVDGSGLRNVTNASGDDELPAWSPDGVRLAFQSGGTVRDIYLIDADGTNRVRLTGGQTTINGAPSWSPDGSHIAFESTRHQDAARADFGRFEIYVMRSDGADVRRITYLSSDTRAVRAPTWSPDGTRIAFESQEAMELQLAFRYRIMVVDADGTNPREIATDQGARFPRWSPP